MSAVTMQPYTPALVPATGEDEDPAADAAAAALAGHPAEAETETGAGHSGEGLAAFSALLAPHAVAFAAADEWPKKAADLPGELLAFSTLAKAREFLGPSVTTQYFMQTTDGSGNIVLQPLQRHNATSAELDNLKAVEPSYSTTGATFTFTPTAANRPSEATFGKLHSLDQTALAWLHGTVAANGLPVMEYLDAGGNPSLTAVLSAARDRVYIVQDLDKTKFANMALADQQAIAATQAFKNVSTILGLGATQAEVEAVIDARLQAILKMFNDKLPTTTVLLPGDAASAQRTLNDRVGIFTTEHLAIYTGQIELIRQSVQSNLAIFDKKQIDDKLADIQMRFERALAFGDLPIHHSDINDPTKAVQLVNGGTGQGAKAYTNLISPPNNSSLWSSFRLFTETDRARLEVETTVFYLTKAARGEDIPAEYHDRVYPLPNSAAATTFRLQLYRNVISDGEISCYSEEVRAQQDLIQQYSAFQEAVGNTTKDITVTSNVQPSYLRGNTTVHSNTYTDAEIRVSSMFQMHAGGVNKKAPLHPIEVLRGIDSRPYFELFNANGQGVKRSLTEWAQLSAQLKETITVIGQDIQQKTNAATEREKQKSRNYDLANEVNAQIYDLIRDLASTWF